MKKTLIAVALASLTLPALAQQKAPEPDFTISGNFTVVSDYRYRGISQSDLDPAIQGGFDLTHKSGLYAGVWGSNVSDFANLNGSGLEMDVYGGYRTTVSGIGLDIGALRYIYPGNQGTTNTRATNGSSGKSYDTNELYLGLSYGPVTYKYSHMISKNWFGYYADSGSQYHDVTLSLPLTDKVSAVAHYGMTKVKGNTVLKDYTDYKVGVAYDLGDGFTLGADYIGTSSITSAEKTGFFSSTDPVAFMGKSSGVVYLKKVF